MPNYVENYSVPSMMSIGVEYASFYAALRVIAL